MTPSCLRLSPTPLLFAFLAVACGGVSAGGIPGGPDAGSDSSPSPDGAPTSDAGGMPEGGTGVPCQTSAQCGAGEQCAVPLPGALVCPPADPAVLPQCVRLLARACNEVTIEKACDCAGNDVTWSTGCVGLPMGWVPEYVRHLGACEDGGAPPPPPPPSGCTHDSDCSAGERCGFSVKDACAATGQCLPASDFPACDIACHASCGCDGIDVFDGAVCCGGQYASEPIAHPGSCFGDGGF